MIQSLIKKLTETASPSGYEGPIREIIHEEIKDLADEIKIENEIETTANTTIDTTDLEEDVTSAEDALKKVAERMNI